MIQSLMLAISWQLKPKIKQLQRYNIKLTPLKHKQ